MAISGIILLKTSKRLSHLPLVSIFVFFIALCIFNFQAQLEHIEVPFKRLSEIDNNLILLSMWQGMAEAVVLGLLLLLAFSVALKQKHNKDFNLAPILSWLIIIEMSFHVTIGYDEKGRLVKLLLHLIALLVIISYSLSPKKFSDTGLTISIFFFVIGMVGLGAMSKNCIPERREIFKNKLTDFNYDGVSRVMGIKGLIFPNASAALVVQDIKSITSISIRRFQLFQDYCLLAKPQDKYKSLWFIGITDPDSGRNKNISGHLQERYPYYALAGVSNFFSPDYENIPHTKLIKDGAIKNYQNLAVMPRVFIVHKWSLAKNSDEALQWMLSHPFSFDSEAVVEDTGVSFATSVIKDPYARAEIKSYQPHSVMITTETTYGGLLILSDTYHPDWMVTIDGERSKIFPADLCFRGVFLNPGRHEVKFSYFPKVFYICVWVSFITLFVLVVLVLKGLLVCPALKKAGAGRR